MSWETLRNECHLIRTHDTSNANHADEEPLRGVVGAEPRIYWYPDSGDDLTPLVLDRPENTIGQRIFPLENDENDRPIVLWMNDYGDEYFGFPARFPPFPNRDLWTQLGAQLELVGPFYRYAITSQSRQAPIPLTVFRVCVRDHLNVPANLRPDDGDVYTVMFSCAESSELLTHVFAIHHLLIDVVALISQGGFDGQPPDFNPYEAVLEAIEANAELVGHPEHYIVDHQDHVPEHYRLVLSAMSSWGRGSMLCRRR